MITKLWTAKPHAHPKKLDALGVKWYRKVQSFCPTALTQLKKRLFS